MRAESSASDCCCSCCCCNVNVDTKEELAALVEEDSCCCCVLPVSSPPCSSSQARAGRVVAISTRHEGDMRQRATKAEDSIGTTACAGRRAASPNLHPEPVTTQPKLHPELVHNLTQGILGVTAVLRDNPGHVSRAPTSFVEGAHFHSHKERD